ncbi:MAG: hypothetical protein ACI92I_000366 [Acidimicrobiales bacterium]|jgi:hypothetical protein
MKTICVTLCKDVMTRNIIETDFWPLFREHSDARVIFVVEKGKSFYYENKYKNQNLEVIELSSNNCTKVQRILTYFLRVAIKTESVGYYVMRAKEDGSVSNFNAYTKMFLSKILGNKLWYKRLLRWSFSKTRSTEAVVNIFDVYKPDLLFATSAIDFTFDGVMLNEARRRGIRTVGMTRSWDNLNSHGLVASLPDRFIFQNKYLQGVARDHQDVPYSESNVVIGLPHYDIYKHPESIIESREEFFTHNQLDLNKKFIFYAAADMHRSEQVFPQIFDDLLDSGNLSMPSQMIYRLHSSSLVDRSKIPALKHIITNDVFGKRKRDAVTEFDTKHYVNCMFHADIVINAGSSAAIDAVAFGKPVICLNFDGGVNLPYWLQSNRMYDQFSHYMKLVTTGGTLLVHSQEELVVGINAYLENPMKDNEGRKKILELFVEPYDGKSSNRLARIVVEELM